jgi:Arc/MetJ family transcription regulator
MKMTMHIDEALLERVMEAHGCESKTEAVDMALREMARKAGFRAMVAAPSPFTAAELKAAVEPSYDVAALRAAEPRAVYKAGKSHGKRKRPR